MRRKNNLQVFILYAALFGMAGSAYADCVQRNIVSGSISTRQAAPGDRLEARCDYGQIYDGIYPEIRGGGSCQYSHFEGTTAVADCVAGSGTGTFDVICRLQNMPSLDWCAQT